MRMLRVNFEPYGQEHHQESEIQEGKIRESKIREAISIPFGNPSKTIFRDF